MKLEQYRDFSQEVHQEGATKPLSGQLELTFHCNMRCQHCYVAEDTSKKELSSKEWYYILDQLYEEACLWICFTGGEPLLRDDFLDIYTYAKRLGFLITIFTNGTLITEEIGDYFRKYPPFSIDITLNGITQETYESITQIPGSFTKVMKVIEIIMERNLPLKLKSQAMTLNYSELSRIKEFSERLGVNFGYTTVISSKIDRGIGPCLLRLSPDKVMELEDSEDLTFEKEPPWSHNLFRCPAGTWTFHISPYGEVFLCPFVRRPCFDLKKISFREVFYDEFPKIRSIKYRTDSKCKDCKIYHLCHNCPGRAELETGDPEKPIEYFCRLAHIRAEMKGGLTYVEK